MKTAILVPSDFRNNMDTGVSMFYDLPGVTARTESVRVEIISVDEKEDTEEVKRAKEAGRRVYKQYGRAIA